MTWSFDKIKNSIKFSTLNQAISFGTVTTIIGTILTMIFTYIGTYNPDIVYLILILLLCLTILFVFTMVFLALKTGLTWKIIISVPLTLFLIGLTAICLVNVLTILKYGFLKCDTCP